MPICSAESVDVHKTRKMQHNFVKYAFDCAFLRVNSWRLNIDGRTQLGCEVSGVVWALIWWILGGFRPPEPVTTDIRHDSI